MECELEVIPSNRRSHRLQKLNNTLQGENAAENNLAKTNNINVNIFAPQEQHLDKSAKNLSFSENIMQENETEDLPYKIDPREVVVVSVKPTFNGSRMHPIRFLEEVESYLSKRNLSNDLNATLECLKGDAKNWSDVLSKEWNNYEDFKKDFIDKYWCRETQRRIKKGLEEGRWNPRGVKSMSDYFSWKYSEAKRLTCFTYDCINTITEEIMQHYSEEVRKLWVISGVKGPAAAIRFLKRIEGTFEAKCGRLPGNGRCRRNRFNRRNNYNMFHHKESRRNIITESTMVGVQIKPDQLMYEAI